MCSVVTPDLRRVITVMRTATIPTPSVIVDQIDIVFSPRIRIPSSRGTCQQKGQGMGPVDQAGQQAFSLCLLGITRVPIR
jgi:hypothetical protein